MPLDIALEWNVDHADLALASGDLAMDDSLKTAVIVSLFTDARCDPDELPDGETDRRGWWGDGLAAEGEGLIGSKLWLLQREKQTERTRQRAEQYAAEALQWLVADGHALAVEVRAEWVSRSVLGLFVAVTMPDGSTFTLQNTVSTGG